MLGIVDETFRDGPQSLWATRMKTEHMLGATPWTNRAGFEKVCVTSGAAFETAVKFLRDDPWERLELLKRYLPDATIDVLIRSRNLFGWSLYPDDVVEALFQGLKDTGTDWVKVFDGLNDVSIIAAHFRIARQVGLKTSGMIAFSESPVHTDAYFAAKARELIACGVDRILMADASGIMTGPRARSLMAALNAEVRGEVPIEFYAHECMGLSHDSVREALLAGVAAVATAAEPLANGESVPSTLDILAIADELGIETAVDRDAVRGLDDYFHWIAYREGRPVVPKVQFDPLRYRRFVGHQIPGGMMSNFRNQLAELGLIHRIDEVLEEASRVREELGYPIMVTPFSQFVGVQATFNVIQGERYRTVPHELALYAKGHYGRSPGPIDPNVLDRILAGKDRSREDSQAIFATPMLPEYRRVHGPFKSDRELLVHLFYGREHAQAIARDKNRFDGRPTLGHPLRLLVEELARDGSLASFKLEKGAVRLEARFA